MINVGQKVTFRPFKGMSTSGLNSCADVVATGTVKYINGKHRWFSVEYGDEYKRLISFNFNDIGKDVKICKE